MVRLANGVYSVHSTEVRETFHPVIGPAAEAEALYVRQLRLPERVQSASAEFVIWDIGLGAAANPLTVLRSVRASQGAIRLLSFDSSLEPLRFGLNHAEELGYYAGYETALRDLLERHQARFADDQLSVEWNVQVGDFPTLLRHHDSEQWPKPDAILFDAFSPAKNPAMWTLPLFRDLFRRLDPERGCALATYSRSTLLRVTLLLAGFFVGAGEATGEKEETTIAANRAELIPRLLDCHWLARARRSTSAEPLREPVYQQRPLAGQTWEDLQAHPQFR